MIKMEAHVCMTRVISKEARNTEGNLPTETGKTKWNGKTNAPLGFWDIRQQGQSYLDESMFDPPKEKLKNKECWNMLMI